MVAARLANLENGQHANRNAASIEAATTQTDAADLMDVSRSMVAAGKEGPEARRGSVVKTFGTPPRQIRRSGRLQLGGRSTFCHVPEVCFASRLAESQSKQCHNLVTYTLA